MKKNYPIPPKGITIKGSKVTGDGITQNIFGEVNPNKTIKNTGQSEGINIIDTTNNVGYLDLIEDYKIALILLENALKTMELLAEEANYTSVRWTNEHITPIENFLTQNGRKI